MQMSMMEQLKRKSVIEQLNSLGVHTIDGQSLHKVEYSTLVRTLAVKRAAQE